MRQRFRYEKYSGGDNLIYRLRIPAEEIGYLSGTMEAYGGIGLVRTIDEHLGVVEIWVPVEQREEFGLLLKALGREIKIEVLEER